MGGGGAIICRAKILGMWAGTISYCMLTTSIFGDNSHVNAENIIFSELELLRVEIIIIIEYVDLCKYLGIQFVSNCFFM